MNGFDIIAMTYILPESFAMDPTLDFFDKHSLPIDSSFRIHAYDELAATHPPGESPPLCQHLDTLHLPLDAGASRQSRTAARASVYRSSSEDTSVADLSSPQAAAVTATVIDSDADNASNISTNSSLLNFAKVDPDQALLDYESQQVQLRVTARIHGMFSLAAGSPPSTPSVHSKPKLACYRRNLFQVSGSLSIPSKLQYVLTDIGQQIEIVRKELTITSVEDSESIPIKLVSVPGRALYGPQQTPEDKAGREPLPIPVSLDTSYVLSANLVDIPFQWKRLQFRTATANNGRRRELQQTYTLYVSLVALLANGETMTLARVQTNGMIVRGRSPRNFSSRKDKPISGSGHHARKHTTLMDQRVRASTNEAAKIIQTTRRGGVSANAAMDTRSLVASSTILPSTPSSTHPMHAGYAAGSPAYAPYPGQVPSDGGVNNNIYALNAATHAEHMTPVIRSSPGHHLPQEANRAYLSMWTPEFDFHGSGQANQSTARTTFMPNAAIGTTGGDLQVDPQSQRLHHRPQGERRQYQQQQHAMSLLGQDFADMNPPGSSSSAQSSPSKPLFVGAEYSNIQSDIGLPSGTDTLYEYFPIEQGSGEEWMMPGTQH